MSVVGIDFGNESSYVAVARQGGIETIDNDYSLRATPSCVAFGEKQRILGVAAKNQLVTNLKNTLFDFKRFIGRKYDDPASQNLAANKPYAVVPTSTGGTGVEVSYLGKNTVFSIEQITAMLLTKLKETTETALQTKVSDCVISCPSYFTNAEREALLDACATSGFNVLRLMNDTAASALTYAFYKQDLPGLDEPPRHVFFVDCGHSALQAFVCAFNKGKLKVLTTVSDPFLGGRDFDAVIASHFIEEFRKKYNLDASTNTRAYIRLMTEVDKLKKQMSANSTKLPLNIECFMNDVDVSSSLSRTEFEEMAAPLFKRAEATLFKCLEDSQLNLEDIHSVEIIGGSSRIPAIKQLIEKAYGKVPSTTLNQDEAVARGCAIQCAILSPTYKVKEVSISDNQPYPVKIVFDESSGRNGEMEIFPRFHPTPFSKMMTFYRRDPFTVKAVYDSEVPFPSRYIGSFKINGVKPTPEGENAKIKVKTKVNLHGIFTVAQAQTFEKFEVEEEVDEEPMDVDPPNPASNPNENATPNAESKEPNKDDTEGNAKSAENGPGSNGASEEAPKEVVVEKKKVKVKKTKERSINLLVEHSTYALPREQLHLLIESECQMVSQDRREKERVDVKNALEEYVYNLRDKLENDYKEFVDEAERSKMISSLNDLENWLYEEGSEEERSVYAQKLEELKKVGDSAKKKLDESLKQKMEEDLPQEPAVDPPVESANTENNAPESTPQATPN